MNTELISDLARFDSALHYRIAAIQAGISPNGEHPNGNLTQALSGTNPEAEQQFNGEYRWAVALTTYPYHPEEDKPVLMDTATDGLYMAGETYCPEAEPDFLKHLGVIASIHLQKQFGEVDRGDIPLPHELEDFILGPATTEEIVESSDSTLPKEDGPSLYTVTENEVDDSQASITEETEETTRESLKRATTRQLRFRGDTLPADHPFKRLTRLGYQGRMAAYRAGELTRRELTAWAGWFPDEVPTVDGEFEWIYCRLADTEVS